MRSQNSFWNLHPFAILNILIIPFAFAQAEPKIFWSSSTANVSDLIRTAYPLGNGRLGALAFGTPGHETLSLNLDSLWSGGPFEVSNYTGGNPTEAVSAQARQDIRSTIFENGTGNVDALLGSNSFYGSYQVLGNLSVTLSGVAINGTVEGYKRSLDIDRGMHSTKFTWNGTQFETTTFCSFPDQVCLYSISASDVLPELEVKLDNALVNSALKNLSCAGGEGSVRMKGVTQLGPPEGMRYDALAQVVSGSGAQTSCNEASGGLKVIPGGGTKTVTVVVGAGTNYDIEKGNVENDYSFRGEDPGPLVESTVKAAASKSLADLQETHETDFQSLTGRFTLSLPDSNNSSSIETAQLFSRYNSTTPTGDPYLESLLFSYANYLFISSSRPGSLPTNLQGRWSEGLTADWSADYHANINVQMNHWTPDQTGLTELQAPLWDYMSKTWVPRGQETAKLLYGAPGWVVHNEMNIFGHTAMKDTAQWADYPAAPAWMMLHVLDHWEYSQNDTWLKEQGYPMVKGVAEFWLDQLQEDAFFNDGSLVVNPCNSPEHGPTTFGCTHYQQLIHQIFDAVLSISTTVDETDTAFLANVTESLEKLDKGLHIGSWGQIKEWKLPDSYGLETMNDTHRHLSDLVGWYPGASISSFASGYTNSTIQSAVANKLYSRGIGNGPDANAGWEKVWRAACWARLNNTERAHFELRYAIEQNFAGNGFSMYNGHSSPFQIDANYGFGGAVLSMLVVDMPTAVGEEGVKTVVLGPAIPAVWGGGSVKGLRLRGGGVVDFEWDESGLVTKASVTGRESKVSIINGAESLLVEI